MRFGTILKNVKNRPKINEQLSANELQKHISRLIYENTKLQAELLCTKIKFNSNAEDVIPGNTNKNKLVFVAGETAEKKNFTPIKTEIIEEVVNGNHHTPQGLTNSNTSSIAGFSVSSSSTTSTDEEEESGVVLNSTARAITVSPRIAIPTETISKTSLDLDVDEQYSNADQIHFNSEEKIETLKIVKNVSPIIQNRNITPHSLSAKNSTPCSLLNMNANGMELYINEIEALNNLLQKENHKNKKLINNTYIYQQEIHSNSNMISELQSKLNYMQQTLLTYNKLNDNLQFQLSCFQQTFPEFANTVTKMYQRHLSEIKQNSINNHRSEGSSHSGKYGSPSIVSPSPMISDASLALADNMLPFFPVPQSSIISANVVNDDVKEIVEDINASVISQDQEILLKYLLHQQTKYLWDVDTSVVNALKNKNIIHSMYGLHIYENEKERRILRKKNMMLKRKIRYRQKYKQQRSDLLSVPNSNRSELNGVRRSERLMSCTSTNISSTLAVTQKSQKGSDGYVGYYDERKGYSKSNVSCVSLYYHNSGGRRRKKQSATSVVWEMLSQIGNNGFT